MSVLDSSSTTPVEGESDGLQEQQQQPTQHAQQQVDWESRYKGLQRTFDTLSKEHKALKEKHDQVLGELETIRQESRKAVEEVSGTKTSLQALESEKKALEEELARNRAHVERNKIILSKYPDLAKFEAEGLLPSGDSVEELDKKLEVFRKAISDSVNRAANDKLQGFTPPSSANNTPPVAPSKESIFAELQRLAGNTSSEAKARYNELIAIWDQLYKS